MKLLFADVSSEPKIVRAAALLELGLGARRFHFVTGGRAPN